MVDLDQTLLLALEDHHNLSLVQELMRTDHPADHHAQQVATTHLRTLDLDHRRIDPRALGNEEQVMTEQLQLFNHQTSASRTGGLAKHDINPNFVKHNLVQREILSSNISKALR